MKYQIIEAGSPAELEKNVRKEIAEGWEPQGGVAVYCYQDAVDGGTSFISYSYFYQAMIKESK